MHRPIPLILTSLLVAVAGCGDDAQPPPPFDAVEVQPSSPNPEGIAYPTEDLGARPRSTSAPGQRIPNFAFQGYPDSDRSQGLRVVSMADLFDPSGSKRKVLHLMAAVAWCPHCSAQTDAMGKVHESLRAKGVQVVQALMAGYEPSWAISLEDLDRWVDAHATPFTVVFDVEGKRLSTVASVSAVPWNALIDLRSMEVLKAHPGSPADYEAWVEAGLDWVAENPPRD